MAGKTLTVYLAADLKKFNKGIKQGETGLKGFGQSMSKYLGPALIAAGAAAGAFAVKLGVEAVGAASDLMETTNKVGVIFGDAAGEMIEFADTAVTALGQTRTQALEGAATFAQYGKAAGLSSGELVDFSTELLTLSADLASFNNSSPEDAINAIGSALRGEAEPMRKFGVLLNDATLKEKALELGLYSGTGALDQQAKVLSAYEVIMSQTTDAQGDFARTSDGLANTTRILSSAVDDAKASIGVGLVGALEAATQSLGGPGAMADTISETGEQVGTFITGLGVLIGTLDDLVPATEKVAGETEKAGAAQGSYTEAVVHADDPLVAIGNLVWKFVSSLGAEEEALKAATGVTYTHSSAIEGLGLEYNLLKDEVDGVTAALALQQAQTKMSRDVAQSQNKDYVDFAARQKNLAEEVVESTTVTTAARRVAATVTEELTKKEQKLIDTQDYLKESIKGTKDELTSQVDSLKDARDAVNDYAASIQQNLLGGIDLEAAFTGQFNEAGQATGISLLEGFNKQIEQATYFGNVLTAIKAQGADQSLIEQVASLGPITGTALGQQLIDDGLVPTMNDKWNSVQETTATLAMGLVPEFLTAGVTAGIETVNGLAEQLSKEGNRLAKIGKKIAKPVGASFKAQLAKDVAEAIANVEAAGSAARAGAIARAEAQQAAITEQQVALAIGNIIRQSDARSGAVVTPVLA